MQYKNRNLRQIRWTLPLGIAFALILLALLSCNLSPPSENLGDPEIARQWVSSKQTAQQAVEVDLSSLDLEQGLISEFWSDRGYKSTATAGYQNQAGEEIVRLIAIQYPSVEAMKRDEGSSAPFYEQEQALADLYCHPPVCIWRIYFFEPWLFVTMYYQEDLDATRDGLFEALSSK